ncbi:gypsy retrotransposon integrase 1-like protein [Plakobranchus ocellatus]|uniref:Gypsy retrotransposon integrase 1-like protein n=1 Tax=Plakobranchus ocellatus TaxID=259542 RepID=A0AAV4AJB1_9GAST|nr:gypsy retrotransposon integrase 1-like protein [Plakobranchus ocellatus]
METYGRLDGDTCTGKRTVVGINNQNGMAAEANLDHLIFEHLTHEKFKQAIERDDMLYGVKKLATKATEIISRRFEKVSIDIAGPLNLTRSRNRFILTMVDAATRWPEAVPLKGFGTREVAEALFGIFSKLGIPITAPSPSSGPSGRSADLTQWKQDVIICLEENDNMTFIKDSLQSDTLRSGLVVLVYLREFIVTRSVS